MIEPAQINFVEFNYKLLVFCYWLLSKFVFTRKYVRDAQSTHFRLNTILRPSKK